MHDHYGLSNEQWKALQKQGVTVRHLFEMRKIFDPNDSEAECGCVMSLLHYVDDKGDFNQPPTKLPHKLVAKAIFENLEIREKISVAEYIELAENNYEDETDEDET